MAPISLPLYPDGEVPYSIASSERESGSVEPLPKRTILLVRKVQVPTISVYLPDPAEATGDAVVICPGGGYEVLAYEWEGTEIAERWVRQGIAAIVLKYRLPSRVSQTHPHLCPLADAKRAMRLVRYHANDWNITGKLGVQGFSAGGHLASTVCTQFDRGISESADPVERLSCRPDFSILVYPVISFSADFAHLGSRRNLLQEKPAHSLLSRFSAESQVTNETPPALLIHAIDDPVVPYQHSLVFLEALRRQGVAATMHLYPRGEHGFSQAQNDRFLATWFERCCEWLSDLRDSSAPTPARHE
jgi:acetyl esterase/lipase